MPIDIAFKYEHSTVLIGRSHGVMVSTLDFESSDPSSNLGGTSGFCENAANLAAGGSAENIQGIPKIDL